ncbi:hypothetical protein G7046_g6434 [Stylonectria norvegica]|nr:hypothetical protein G7046_g6434 [Stylonectria norvegica]
MIQAQVTNLGRRTTLFLLLGRSESRTLMHTPDRVRGVRPASAHSAALNSVHTVTCRLGALERSVERRLVGGGGRLVARLRCDAPRFASVCFWAAKGPLELGSVAIVWPGLRCRPATSFSPTEVGISSPRSLHIQSPSLSVSNTFTAQEHPGVTTCSLWSQLITYKLASAEPSLPRDKPTRPRCRHANGSPPGAGP